MRLRFIGTFVALTLAAAIGTLVAAEDKPSPSPTPAVATTPAPAPHVDEVTTRVVKVISCKGNGTKCKKVGKVCQVSISKCPHPYSAVCWNTREGGCDCECISK